MFACITHDERPFPHFQELNIVFEYNMVHHKKVTDPLHLTPTSAHKQPVPAAIVPSFEYHLLDVLKRPLNVNRSTVGQQ